METMKTKDVKLPSWGWHYTDQILEAKMAASVRKHGVVFPIVVSDDGVVIDGRLRLRGALLAGLKDVPVVRLIVGEQAAQRLAMDLELRARIDFVKFAKASCDYIAAGGDPSEMASTGQFSTDRIAGFVKLSTFDWSMFGDEPDGQQGFGELWGEAPDPIVQEPAPLPVMPVKPKREKKEKGEAKPKAKAKAKAKQPEQKTEPVEPVAPSEPPPPTPPPPPPPPPRVKSATELAIEAEIADERRRINEEKGAPAPADPLVVQGVAPDDNDEDLF